MSDSGMAPSKIQVRLLGSFTVSSGGRDLTPALAQPKRVALVALLALSRPQGLHRRDSLCAQLWPESPDAKARTALRQLLLVLRRELGEDAFVTSGDLVGLNGDRIETDAGAVFDALEAGDDAAAVEGYSGELLPGFHVPESEPFERWLDECGSILRREVRGAAWRLVDRAEIGGDLSAARLAAERATRLDPENESGLRRLLTLQARTGDRGAALRTAEEFVRHLRQDWEADPEEATGDLLERIRAGQLAPAPLRESSRTATPTQGPDPVRPRLRSRTGAIASLVAVSAVVLAVWRPGHPERPVQANRVMVAPFENQTGDSSLAALGSMAADWLAGGILQAGVGEVVDPVTVFFAARDLGPAPPGAATMKRVEALAEAGAAGVIVTGFITSQADSVVFQVQVSDGLAARLVGSFRVASPIRTVATAGIEQLRSVVGGFVVARLDPRVRSVRPPIGPAPRLDAYRHFVDGLAAFGPRRYAEALADFLSAARLDPTFVPAVVWACYAARNGGNRTMADSLTRAAADVLARLGPQLAPLDRYGLKLLLPPDTTTLRTLAAAAALAPGSDFAYRLAREYTFDYEKSIALYQTIDHRVGWARDWPDFYISFGRALHLAGKNARAADLISEAVRKGVDSPELRSVQALALAAAGRTAEVGAAIDGLEALPVDPVYLPGVVMAQAAGELLRVGRRSEGARLLERAGDWVESHRATLSAGDYVRCRAWIASFAEEWDDSITWFERLGTKPPADWGLGDYLDQSRFAIVAAFRHRDSLAAGAMESIEWEGPDRPLRAMIAAVSGSDDEAVRRIQERAASEWAYWYQESILHDPLFARFRDSSAWRTFMEGKR